MVNITASNTLMKAQPQESGKSRRILFYYLHKNVFAIIHSYQATPMKPILTIIIQPLERFLKTDIRYLAHGSFWLSISSATGTLIAFVLSVAYARFLPKELYGSYRFILSTIGMAGIFSLPGMSTAIIRAAARGYDGTFRRGSCIIFFSSIGISLVGFLTALFFFVKGNIPVAYGLCIASVLVPFVEGLGNWRGYLDGKKEFQKKTLYNVLSHLVYG